MPNGTPRCLRFEKVILATDFLENSRLALDYAVGFADRYKAMLSIVHAFAPPREALEAEHIAHHPSVSRIAALNRLDALAMGVRRLGIDTATDLRDGDPSSAVLDMVNGKCDLLVLGTHGNYKGFGHLLIGSNAEKILHAAKCPTLTVGRHVLAGVDLRLAFSEIFLVTQLRPDDQQAAFYGTMLSKEFGAPLTVLRLKSEAEKNDDAAVSSFMNSLAVPATDESPIQYRTETFTDVADVIRRLEKSTGGLIVTPVHSIGRLDRHFHSSFNFELTARASCPVLSVRSEDSHALKQ